VPLLRATAGAHDLKRLRRVAGVAHAAQVIFIERRVKLGQPVPLSNFVPALNSGSPHRRQVNTPSRFSARKTPQNGSSSP
jgi:hypothetical protein